MVADVEATLEALRVRFAARAELTVDFCVDLILEHAGTIVSLTWLLVALQILYLRLLVLNDLLQVSETAMFGQALSEEGLATLIAADLYTRAVLLQMNLQLLLRHLTRGARRRHASLPLR